MPEPTVWLQIGEQRYAGWTAIRIGRSIETISGLFELTVTERSPDRGRGQGPEAPARRPIRPGDACAVLLDELPVITGFVDEVGIDYDAQAHTVTVRGRDRTADLVDCSADSGEFKQQTLAQITDTLARPYGVPVEITTDIGAALRSFAVQEGETVFESLERAARHRGVLLLTDGRGGLKLARPSKERLDTELRLGINVLRARGQFSYRERYRTYLVKGQAQGDDTAWGAPVAEPAAPATDTDIREVRTLVVIAEEQADIKTCADRAVWERNVRMGRGTTIAYTVQGWTYDGMHPWPVNRLVPVRDDWLGVNMDLLIASVAYVLDERGTVTELTCTRPEAFELTEIPEPKAQESWLTR